MRIVFRGTVGNFLRRSGGGGRGGSGGGGGGAGSRGFELRRSVSRGGIGRGRGSDGRGASRVEQVNAPGAWRYQNPVPDGRHVVILDEEG